MTKKLFLSFICIAIVSLLSGSIIYAQNFESGSREVDRPIRARAEKELQKTPEKAPIIKEEKTPVKEEGPAYFIKKVVLSGCETFPAEDFSGIVKDYENRELKFTELEEMGQRIEREYLKKGVIAACVIPPQEIKDGVVTIYVIEAKMGELEIQRHKYFNNKLLKRYWRTKTGSTLIYYQISRSLQQMNRNPDREVKAALRAGKKQGTTDVVLNVTTHFPVHPTFSFSREGAMTTGRESIGFGARHNNFLNLDDTLLTGYSYTKHSNNVYAYHLLPVNGSGTNLIYGFSRSEAFPKKDFERYDLRSYAKGMSFFLHQDIYEKDDYKADLYFGIDGRDKEVYTNTGLINKDRLRVLRIGTKAVLKGGRTTINITPEFSQGLNLFGARRKSDLSSRDAENTFSKFNLNFQCKHYLTSYIQFSVKSDFQLASEKLAPQEEFSFGGINSVRGYAYGDYYGDNAIQVNVELLVQPVFLPDSIKLPFSKTPLKENITGFISFDYGYGTKRGNIQGEKSKDTLASVGTGVRINLYDQIMLRLEGGFPISLGDKGITEGARPRLHVTVEFEDKLLDNVANMMAKK